MRDLTVRTDRATASVTRLLVAEFEGIELARLASSLRAAAIRRAERLRGAYRDLAPSSVPGVTTCAALLKAIGAFGLRTTASGARGGESSDRGYGADALVTRLLADRGPFEIETGMELEYALALESMAPIALADRDSVEGSLCVRFGREDERLPEVRGRNARSTDGRALRGRVALFDAIGPVLAGGAVAGRCRVTPRTRALLVAAFLLPWQAPALGSGGRIGGGSNQAAAPLSPTDALRTCETLLRVPAAASNLARLASPHGFDPSEDGDFAENTNDRDGHPADDPTNPAR